MEELEEKKIHLSNGNLLIRTEEGIYFISHGEKGMPLLIEQEEGERLLIETVEQLKTVLENVVNKEGTKVKFLKEIDVVIQDDELDEDERNASFSICECMKCHWKFIGECERHGYGFTSQGVQIPDFCPMCASKIVDVVE
jgi:predicted Zn-ribbon and HTH transcriptional regulator